MTEREAASRLVMKLSHQQRKSFCIEHNLHDCTFEEDACWRQDCVWCGFDAVEAIWDNLKEEDEK